MCVHTYVYLEISYVRLHIYVLSYWKIIIVVGCVTIKKWGRSWPEVSVLGVLGGLSTVWPHWDWEVSISAHHNLFLGILWYTGWKSLSYKQRFSCMWQSKKIITIRVTSRQNCIFSSCGTALFHKALKAGSVLQCKALGCRFHRLWGVTLIQVVQDGLSPPPSLSHWEEEKGIACKVLGHFHPYFIGQNLSSKGGWET